MPQPTLKDDLACAIISAMIIQTVQATAQQLTQQSDFWHYQAKDVITLLIAVAAFLTASTNVWVAYIRPRRLKCDLADTLRIFYSSRPQHILRFLVDVFAINTGAKPGVISRMAIEISGSNNKSTVLRWREIMKNEDIADAGEPRKVWTRFVGFASAVLVPKYDAKLVEAVFLADENFDLVEGVTYRFRLLYWLAGKEKCFRGGERQLAITPSIFKFLETRATANQIGITERLLFTTSTDGKTFLTPPAANLMQTETTPSTPLPPPAV
jgi:hypothetical protein